MAKSAALRTTLRDRPSARSVFEVGTRCPRQKSVPRTRQGKALGESRQGERRHEWVPASRSVPDGWAPR
jgi:hypothetical protein